MQQVQFFSRCIQDAKQFKENITFTADVNGKWQMNALRGYSNHIIFQLVRFEIFTAVTMKNGDFWDVRLF
jgi:hypothetical protein